MGDVLWKDEGCGSELIYIEQMSWIIFLKYLDDLEKVRVMKAFLSGKILGRSIRILEK
ncbi:MAG: type I restriction-modification system subunit M N-terminal domain-containing protein [Psychrobacillus psychrodurans]